MRYRLRPIVLILGLLLPLQVHSDEIWKIASLNWEPYSSARMTTQGNAIQKLRTLLKKNNITLQVDFYPWERAKRVARDEEYVGYFPAWPEEVTEGFVSSPVVDWSWIGILSRVDAELKYQQLDELFQRYKVGLVSSYVYPEEIMVPARESADNIIYAPNEISLLKMLVAGRQDCAITDPNVMAYLSERDGIGEIKTIETLLKKELVIAMRDSEDNRRRIELLNSLMNTNR